MADYNCKVVTPEGAILNRTVSADSMEALHENLKQRKEQLLSAKKAGFFSTFDLNKYLEQMKKVTPREMKMFTNQLKVMLKAGIPILKCLDAIERQATTEKFRGVVKGLLKNVTGGASLSKAMGNSPEVFSNLYVSMIAAGESSGSLDKMLDQLEVFSEIDIKLKSNIKSALRYPMIVSGVMVIAGYIILTKVIPVFTQMFQSLGADLPITTKALIAMSGFLQEYGMITILSTAGTFFLVRTYIKTPGGAFQWDKLKLNLPVIKTVIRSGGMARFSLTLNTLVGSGVQIVDAFEITRKTIGNLVFEQVISEAREKIIQGSSVHEALEHELIPSVARNMIAIGEESGSLNPMLTNISEYYLAELDEKLEGLSAAIEPILTVVIGGFVAGFVASIFLPMFGLYNAVG